MSAPVIVSDLECLSDVSLFCIEPGNIRRVAYYAGLIGGLNIAHEYCRVGAANSNPKLWSLLSGTEYPRPPLPEFVKRVKEYVYSTEFNFDYDWMPEHGLRHGEPGDYYAKGIADAVRVAIHQIPVHFEYICEDQWEKYTLNWINEKLALANVKLEMEKSLHSKSR